MLRPDRFRPRRACSAGGTTVDVRGPRLRRCDRAREPGMARKLSGDLRDVVVPDADARPARPRTPSRCGDSRATSSTRSEIAARFDGVHLIPVGRYRETGRVARSPAPAPASSWVGLRVGGDGDGVGVAAAAEDGAGAGAGRLAVGDDRGAVDDHVRDADRVGVQAARAAGQVVDAASPRRSRPSRVEAATTSAW